MSRNIFTVVEVHWKCNYIEKAFLIISTFISPSIKIIRIFINSTDDANSHKCNFYEYLGTIFRPSLTQTINNTDAAELAFFDAQKSARS